MSRVSFFQRYSQRENHATNNTLLAIRHFYEVSPLKAQAVLTELLGEDNASVGLNFEQQKREESSIPYGLISQESLSVYIETKTSGGLVEDQIRRHMKGIRAKLNGLGGKLLCITKSPTVNLAAFEKMGKELGVSFHAATFSDVLDALSSACEAYETQLTGIVKDYEGYLDSENILAERGRFMAIFPCSTTFDANVKYRIYYEKDSRPTKAWQKFIGVYRDKCVHYVGEIERVSVCYKRKELSVEYGEVSSRKSLNRINEVIDNTAYYDLADTPTRFYLLSSVAKTSFPKVTRGGIMGYRRFDLKDMLGGQWSRDMTTDQLADGLVGKTFN
jgi:hypothetical protein